MWYMNKTTGELFLNKKEMLKDFAEYYDGGDPTNIVHWSEIYEQIEDREQKLIMNEKYRIAKEVEIEDLKNAIEILDFNPNDFTDEQINEIFVDLNYSLAENDTYNDIYNQTLYDILMTKRGDKNVV